MIVRGNGLLQARKHSAGTVWACSATSSAAQPSITLSKSVAPRPDSKLGTRALSVDRRFSINRSCGLSLPIRFHRPFSTSTSFQKQKKGRSSRDEDAEQESQSTSGSSSSKKRDVPNISSSSTPISDVTSLSTFKTDTQKVQEKLKKGLAGLKPGGRFDPTLIEMLRVDMSKLHPNNDAAQEKSHAKAVKNEEPPQGQHPPSQQSPADPKKEKKSKSRGSIYAKPSVTATLTEMAQVIPRGAKTVLIMLNEEAFAKPVMSALLGSRYSLNPSVSPTNPLELIVPIPPPSAELRANTLSQVDKLRERAETDLRDRRAGMQKELRTLQLSNQVGPDAYHDTHKKMEKVMDEAKVEIKRLCDASRKVLQQS